MSDWQNVALGEILDVHNGFAFKSKDFLEQGVPVIKIKNVKPNTILLDTLSYVSEELASQKSGYLIKPDDILITMSGNRFDGSPETWVGKVALFKIKGTYLLNQRVSCLRVDRKLALPEFIAYLLSSWHYQVYFINHANSSGGQANISPTIVKEVEIDLPSLEEQEAITAVLASLDDKIDLLHRQNKTLESLAQTLFRHWFIDGAEDDWEDGCLGDISENVRDSIGHGRIPNGTIYIGLEHIDKKNIALNNHGLSDDVQSNKYQFTEGDILFGKLRPYFHKVCFSPFSGVCSTDILVLRPKQPHYFCFSLFAFFQDDVVEYANIGSGGTRMPRTNWETLKQYPLQVPPEEKIKHFNELIYPSIEKIKKNLVQIRTLEKLRDTLLPKLMSGEVRVRLRQQN